MSQESLCLSRNNDSQQVRCVETKTQQRKDDLKVYLQGVLKGTNDLQTVQGHYKTWLKKYLFGKKRISRPFFRFLVDFLSLEHTPIPRAKQVNVMYEQFIRLKELDLSLLDLYKEFQQYGILRNTNTASWEVLTKALSIILQDDSLAPIHIFRDYERMRANLHIAFRRFPETMQYLVESEIILSRKLNDSIINGSAESFEFIMAHLQQVAVVDYTYPEFKKRLVYFLLDHFNINSIDEEVSQQEIPVIAKEKQQLMDRYTNIYRSLDDTYFIEKIYDYLTNKKFPSGEEQINYLLEIASKANKQINIEKILRSREADAEMRIADEFIRSMITSGHLLDSNIDNFIKMMDISLEILKKRRVKPLFRNISFDVNYDHTVWAMDVYDKFKEYAVNSFSTLESFASLSYNSFHGYLLSKLFFRYEKPWILINNLDNSAYQCMEELIQNKRINHCNNLPLPVSKKEAHLFYELFHRDNTPRINNNDVLYSAIVYVKLYKLGVSKDVLQEIISSGQIRNNGYKFWEATAPFFARYQAQMEFGEARDIIDFLTQHEDFNIKGRTLKSMRRIVQQWHEELAQSRNNINNINQSWERTGEGDYYFDNEHLITELTTGKQLHWEGQFQHHCVSAYTDRCATGKVAIWSLRKLIDKELEKPMVTIEVEGKEIVQIKGKFNRQPNELEILMIHEWAKERNLKINSGWW